MANTSYRIHLPQCPDCAGTGVILEYREVPEYPGKRTPFVTGTCVACKGTGTKRAHDQRELTADEYAAGYIYLWRVSRAMVEAPYGEAGDGLDLVLAQKRALLCEAHDKGYTAEIGMAQKLSRLMGDM